MNENCELVIVVPNDVTVTIETPDYRFHGRLDSAMRAFLSREFGMILSGPVQATAGEQVRAYPALTVSVPWGRIEWLADVLHTVAEQAHPHVLLIGTPGWLMDIRVVRPRPTWFRTP